MPIYEFECGSCGQVHEQIMKISDLPPEACETCGKGPMQKLMSRTNFRLKGTGWYETDFKGKQNNPNSTSKEENSPKSSEKGSKGEEKKAPSTTESPATGNS